MYPLPLVILCTGLGVLVGAVLTFLLALLVETRGQQAELQPGVDDQVVNAPERQAKLVSALTRSAHQDVLGGTSLYSPLFDALAGLTIAESVHAMHTAATTALRISRDHEAAATTEDPQDIAQSLVDSAEFNLKMTELTAEPAATETTSPTTHRS